MWVRILVVEDDARQAAMVRRGLTEDGHVIDVVHDGEQAVWQATEVDYDVIVLDVMLPGIDGFEVCRRLREAKRTAPVLMLSARSAVQDRVHGLDSGADDYLAKPFTFTELSARIRALLRRGGTPRAAMLSAGSLTLDPAAHEAWRGGVALGLSHKEFALLELFMRRVGEALTRGFILDHLWDFAYERGSNVVDQYVAYLRRRIDRPFGLEQLETVRGVGYRLRPEPVHLLPVAEAER